MVSLGFALTQHCNLRCPHCIRDDVRTVRSLEVDLIESVLDQAAEVFGNFNVGLTGGEPLLHPRFAGVVQLLAQRRIRYGFVSNGWHVKRALPAIEVYPPALVHLSLSGATEVTHDAERGSGSFRRVLLAAGMLMSRHIPVSFSLVVDRRNRHQLGEAAALAEDLGVGAIMYILPQPVEASVARNSDLPLEDWFQVRREVSALAAVPGRRTRIRLAYGAPFEGEEHPCPTMARQQFSIDAHGRLVTCCQLSDYGYNAAEVVADLKREPLAIAVARHAARIEHLRKATRPTDDGSDPLDPFPCMRCARACGKLDWLQRYPNSVWGRALAVTPMEPNPRNAGLVLVPLSPEYAPSA